MQYSLTKTWSATALAIAAIGVAAPASAAINCNEGGTSVGTSPCTFTGDLAVSATETVSGSLIVTGNLTVQSGGKLVFAANPGSLEVGGTLDVQSGGSLDAKGGNGQSGRALEIDVGANVSISGEINTKGGPTGNTTNNGGNGGPIDVEVHGLWNTGGAITSEGGAGSNSFSGGNAGAITILACSAYVEAEAETRATGGSGGVTRGSGAAILLHTTDEITLEPDATFDVTRGGGSGTGGSNGSITLRTGAAGVVTTGVVFNPAPTIQTSQPGPFLCSVTTGFGKASGGIGYGTIPKRGNSPSHTFDGFVADVDDAITINYRALKTECTFTATSVVFDAIDLKADIDADYTCTGGQMGTATILLSGRGDDHPQDYRGSIAVDATPDNVLDILEQSLETGNVIVAIID